MPYKYRLEKTYLSSSLLIHQLLNYFKIEQNGLVHWSDNSDKILADVAQFYQLDTIKSQNPKLLNDQNHDNKRTVMHVNFPTPLAFSPKRHESHLKLRLHNLWLNDQKTCN